MNVHACGWKPSTKCLRRVQALRTTYGTWSSVSKLSANKNRHTMHSVHKAGRSGRNRAQRCGGRAAEWAPLMMGGSDSTVRLASRMIGYTSARWMSGTNLRSFASCSR